MKHALFLASTTYIILILATPSVADQSACETAVRAHMAESSWPEPLRQNITTTMSGNVVKGTAVSVGPTKVLYSNEAGVPQSLMLDDKFYSSTDGGKSWSLVQTFSAEVMQKIQDDQRKQSEKATDIMCEMNIDLDGKIVNKYSAKSILEIDGSDYSISYWLDAETGFPWRIESEFSSVIKTQIVQVNEPAVGFTLPTP